ncbi:MAG: hypothetical protein G8D88_13895 [gamma proteobacterium symbiont of Ctena orbiculata]
MNKITNTLQRSIDTGTIGLAFCIAAWQAFASDQDVANHGEIVYLALCIALAGFASLNLVKVVIKALFERGEEA